MKTISLFFLLLGLTLSLYTFARVPYMCRPYEPTADCETGLYRVEIRERETDRFPLGVVEAHCLIALPGRLKAVTGRLVKYNPIKRDEVFDAEWFDEQEFPVKNAETCRVE